LRRRAPSPHPRTRLLAELLAGVLGATALFWAWRADATWFELHFTSSYCALDPADRARSVPWRWGFLVAGAVLLLVARPLAGRWVGRRSVRGAVVAATPVALAVVLALVVSELVLRHKRATAPPGPAGAFPLPPVDGEPRLGWHNRPSTMAVLREGGRDVTYAFDAHGFRVRSVDEPVDRTRPSLVFTGESIAAGLGTQYDETFPALVGEALGLQPVNAAVYGYGHDQAYLRLLDTLDLLERPVAVVMPAMTAQLERDVAWDRTVLVLGWDGSLKPRGPVIGLVADSPLVDLWRRIVPYHDLSAVDVARAIFVATAKASRDHGAYPVLVATNYREPCLSGPDGSVPVERLLFDGLDVDVVHVSLDPTWLVDTDMHPDARAHRKLADAIAPALASHLRAAGALPAARSRME
jgi:hypothetical protein